MTPLTRTQLASMKALPAAIKAANCAADALTIAPVTFKQACEFVAALHRHNKPPRGHKFSVGLQNGSGALVGVAMAGRPVARALDDGQTLEVNRTCTDGTRNANSMLYGAVWRAAVAMGYRRCITYTQADESGASLRAAGWVRAADLAPRAGWADSTQAADLKAMRDPVGNGGVPRVRWEISRKSPSTPSPLVGADPDQRQQ